MLYLQIMFVNISRTSLVFCVGQEMVRALNQAHIEALSPPGSTGKYKKLWQKLETHTLSPNNASQTPKLNFSKSS